MNHITGLRLGTLAVLITAVSVLAWPEPASAQTAGMERRDERRDDRGEKRDTKQDGREEGRDAKEQCKDAGGNNIECRQEKREVKQDSREEARGEKHDGDD
jgi:Spy/CpxP family protein refolding chaperone